VLPVRFLHLARPWKPARTVSPGRAALEGAAGGTGARHGAFRVGTGRRIRRAIEAADQSRRYAGYSAVEVAARLQPYLSLLDLDYTLDDFLIAVKKRESDVLRGEASNAVESAPKAAKRRKRIRPPKHEKVYLAVHTTTCCTISAWTQRPSLSSQRSAVA
jgi:hypothetical protein